MNTTTLTSTMKTEIVLMAPKRAKEILENNPCNRAINVKRVKSYIKKIREGTYQLTHQGVAIDWNGILLDGQHRLLAVCESGIAIPLQVSTGCDPAIFTAIDSGRTRSAGDCLGIAGASYGKLAAATVRACAMYYDFADAVWAGHNMDLDSSAVIEWHDIYSDQVAEACQIAKKFSSKFRLITPNAYSSFACLALIEGCSSNYIESFYRELSDGIGLYEGSPVYAFRRALINGYMQLGKVRNRATQQVFLASMITIYNKRAKRQKLSSFRVPLVPPMPKITTDEDLPF